MWPSDDAAPRHHLQGHVWSHSTGEGRSSLEPRKCGGWAELHGGGGGGGGGGRAPAGARREDPGREGGGALGLRRSCAGAAGGSWRPGRRGGALAGRVRVLSAYRKCFSSERDSRRLCSSRELALQSFTWDKLKRPKHIPEDIRLDTPQGGSNIPQRG